MNHHRLRLSFLLLFVIWQHTKSDDSCILAGKKPDKAFPDLYKEGQLSYQVSVTYTPTKAKQTDYFKEYYDILNKRGRVDTSAAGKSSKYYYFQESEESFLVEDGQCVSLNLTAIPKFMEERTTDWLFENEGQPTVRGPSAMFRYALSAWKSKTDSSMAYMGIVGEQIRGLPTQKWRRCIEDSKLVVDYYFTTEDHEDAFGFDSLNVVPLRVIFASTDENSDDELYPQTYDIMSFQPFISDEFNTLEVPAGLGCRRSTKVQEEIDMPTFENTNLFFIGEAVYLNRINNDEAWNYYSTFQFALDVATNHMAYKYSPWASQNSDDDQPGLRDTIYDMANKYIYDYDMANGKCTISRDRLFYPKYYLPKNGGSIDLTDPVFLYPNSEFQYISEGKTRGYDVHEFEATFNDFPLGERTVPKMIVTRKYLKDGIVERNSVAVKNALASIQFKMFDKKDDLAHSNMLTVNFYGFSTQLEYKEHIFKIMGCFKNEDFLWVSMGFPADQTTMDKIKDEVEDIKRNIIESITLESQLNSLRLPIVYVSFSDMINVYLLVLNKPPIALDFDMPVEGKTVIGTSDAEGIQSMEGCAQTCLESEDTCWGFSLCGATCYYGTNFAQVTEKKGCQLYMRFDNTTYVPSNEAVAKSLRTMVQTKQMKIAVPVDDQEQPLFLEASYIDMRASGDRNELFQLLNMQLNPRLRVMRVGSKLAKGGDTVKNFGKLRYDECQRICLDYKICETVSYCLGDSVCILSAQDGDDIKETDFEEDSFCNVLTRKYTDNYQRLPGEILSQTALKTAKVSDLESCSKACMKEQSFDCLSFDYCPDAVNDPCRLHAVHYLDAKKGETGVKKEKVCGHYSKKFSFSFKSEKQRKSVGTGLTVSNNVTTEECAKLCLEYTDKTCYGYDFCEDKTVTSTVCTLLLDDPSYFKTTYSPICTHYLQTSVAASPTYSEGTAAWVGIVCFAVAAIVGVVLTFAIAYFKANRQT